MGEGLKPMRCPLFIIIIFSPIGHPIADVTFYCPKRSALTGFLLKTNQERIQWCLDEHLNMNDPPRDNCHPGGEMTSGGQNTLVNLKTAAKGGVNPTSKTHRSIYNALAAIHVGNNKIINRLGRFVKNEPGMDDTGEDLVIPEKCQSTSDDTSRTPAEETILCLANREAQRSWM
ncbi:MAG: hypothetical protein J3R72DRAFT_481268 [Linnemannia gamsii]|nr:MAG: hypothetical protein J3R72DRAFT_481268 [Linnemannia gamsii]